MGGARKVVTENPNEEWVHARGMWLSYTATTLVAHLALLSLPFISTDTAWSLTNALHSVVRCAVFATE